MCRWGGGTPTVELNQQLSQLMRIHCDQLHVSKNNTLHHKISILIETKGAELEEALEAEPLPYPAPETAQEHLKQADTYRGDAGIKASLNPHDEVAISLRLQVKIKLANVTAGRRDPDG